MYSVALNIILFIIRMSTFIISTILLFNLIADARGVKQENRVNGLWATRIAMIAIIGALVIENGIYAVGYVHSGFESIVLNAWLTNARLFIITARGLVLFGVIKLFILFHHRELK